MKTQVGSSQRHQTYMWEIEGFQSINRIKSASLTYVIKWLFWYNINYDLNLSNYINHFSYFPNPFKPLEPQKKPQQNPQFLFGFDPYPTSWSLDLSQRTFIYHRESGGYPSLGWVPLIINPIYTLYSGYLLGISPFKGLPLGVKQLILLVMPGTKAPHCGHQDLMPSWTLVWGKRGELVRNWSLTCEYNTPTPKTNMTSWKIRHEWRCISSWRWGFSNVMLVFRGVFF